MSEKFEVAVGGMEEARANIQGIPDLEKWAEAAEAFGLSVQEANLVADAWVNAVPVVAE